MLVFDDIFEWEGFGGRLKLARGKCRLRIYDLDQSAAKKLRHMKPMVVVAWDHPDSRMSVGSISGHIATRVVRVFDIDPGRMQFVEYGPEIVYGRHQNRLIPETFEAVEFVWKNKMALHPTKHPVKAPLLSQLKKWFE